jgi:xanthine dehydrogenase accessory factor
MGIREDGVVCGSVSAGCIESSVIESALSRNEPHSLHFDSITNEKAWEVGLSCGGEVEVWIHPGPGPSWSLMRTLLEEDEPFILCTDLEPFQQWIWRPGDPGDDQNEAFRMRRSGLNDKTFLNVMPGRDRLIVVGAVHTAKPLVAMAHELGFETLIIDPRKALAESEQFDPAPGKIIQGWPQDVLPQIRLTEDTYAVGSFGQSADTG